MKKGYVLFLIVISVAVLYVLFIRHIVFFHHEIQRKVAENASDFVSMQKYNLDMANLRTKVAILEAEKWLLKNKNKQITKQLRALEKKYTITATVTAYQAEVAQTDSTPYTTAFMRDLRAEPGTVAVSEDIIKELGWPIGAKVYIEGIGVKTIGDLMNPRWKRRVDVFAPTEAYVKEVGASRRQVSLMLYE